MARKKKQSPEEIEAIARRKMERNTLRKKLLKTGTISPDVDVYRVQKLFEGVANRHSDSLEEMASIYKCYYEKYLQVIFWQNIDMNIWDEDQRWMVSKVHFRGGYKRMVRLSIAKNKEKRYSLPSKQYKEFFSRMKSIRLIAQQQWNEDIIWTSFLEVMWYICVEFKSELRRHEPTHWFALFMNRSIFAYLTWNLLLVTLDEKSLYSTLRMNHLPVDMLIRFTDRFEDLIYEDEYHLRPYIEDDEECGTNWINGECEESLHEISPYDKLIIKILSGDNGKLKILSSELGAFSGSCPTLTAMKRVKRLYNTSTYELRTCPTCGNILYSYFDLFYNCKCNSKGKPLKHAYKAVNPKYYPTKSAKWFVDKEDAFNL